LEIKTEISSKIEKLKDNSRIYRNIISQRKINKKEKPYISVIIPCYNSEKYIDYCMKSVIEQTIGIKNLQIILINNGSKDDTIYKLREWEKKFPDNIIIITYDENLRPGGARNLGICYADADYIGFVDSDDWIEPDMYEVLYKATKEKKWSSVKGKEIIDYDTRESNNLDSAPIEYIYYEYENKNGFYRGEVKNVGKNGRFSGFWSGIYLKELIIKNNVWFPEKLAHEDHYWQSIISLYVKNMCIADKILYHNFYNSSSITAGMNNLGHLDILDVEIMKLEEYKRVKAFDLFYKEFEFEFIKWLYIYTLELVFFRFDYMPDIINFMKEKVHLYFPTFEQDIESPIFDKFSNTEKQLLRLLSVEVYVSTELMNDIKNEVLRNFK